MATSKEGISGEKRRGRRIKEGGQPAGLFSRPFLARSPATRRRRRRRLWHCKYGMEKEREERNGKGRKRRGEAGKIILKSTMAIFSIISLNGVEKEEGGGEGGNGWL